MIQLKKIRRTFILLLSGMLVWFVPSLHAEPGGKLIIFHAGSLSKPLEAMQKTFLEIYPKVEIVREGGGSQQVARKVSEQKKPCDIVASADYKVIDTMLIPEYADWNIRFASNQLVLCYTDKSKYAGQIQAANWYEILQKKDVSWGHSDPNLDPCGYRALMVLQLAEIHYKKPGLNQALLSNRPTENIRPKADELVSMLHNGTLDYAWEYLSVAVQHGLKYVSLPDEINLGNFAHESFYSQASVQVTGKEPGSQMKIQGDSITYGLTMIKQSPNPEAAKAFLQFMLSSNGGLKILKDQGQPPFIPSLVSSEDMKKKLPTELQPLVNVSQ